MVRWHRYLLFRYVLLKPVRPSSQSSLHIGTNWAFTLEQMSRWSSFFIQIRARDAFVLSTVRRYQGIVYRDQSIPEMHYSVRPRIAVEATGWTWMENEKQRNNAAIVVERRFERLGALGTGAVFPGLCARRHVDRRSDTRRAHRDSWRGHEAKKKHLIKYCSPSMTDETEGQDSER